MINITLFKKEWKSNWLLLFLFFCILSMYSIMIIYMFDPELEASLKMMEESMHGVFAAMGMAGVGHTLLEFVTGYLYGMLFIAFPAVYIIILANKLVVKYVDNGSMVYLLSAPDKREKLVRTQAIYLISMLVLLFAASVGVILLCCKGMFPGELQLKAFCRVNIGLFGLWIMVAGICFLFSCLFNESRLAVSFSAGFVIYSLLVQMLANMGEQLEKLKYATPFTLFQISDLIANKQHAFLAAGIMYLIGFAAMVAGILYFKRKNLPL